MPKLPTLETPRFGNWTVLPPEGDAVMFRCQERKVNWYLERKLAVLEKAPNTIRLTFQPKGNGFSDDPFFTCDKENKCYVCGSTEEMTRHHIVPLKYKKHFPTYAFPVGWYDVATLCEGCHVACEVFCQIKNQEFEDRYSTVPVHPHRGLYVVEYGYCRTLLKHGDKLPPHIRETFLAKLQLWLKGAEPTTQRLEALRDELKHLNRKQTRQDSIPAQIMNQVKDLDVFAIEWRQDFVDTMRPQHLPTLWDITRRIYAEVIDMDNS